MTAIYLAPASQENIARSITGRVSTKLLQKYLSPRALDVILAEYKEGRGAPCWAMTRKREGLFRKLSLGQIVLFCTKASGLFEYSAEILFCYDCGPRFGQEVWGYQPSGEWELVYFLRDVRSIHISKKTLLTELGYSPNFELPGFIRVKEEMVRRLLSRHHSVLAWIDSLSAHSPGLPMPVAVASPNEPIINSSRQYVVPPELASLIDEIRRLQKDPEHQERAHESLVEKFYAILGYEIFREILHRQGRIDILISRDQIPAIVNEVKRDWSLNRHTKAAIEQAYRYALDVGAKYVVVTNGDYYAIFDRTSGLSADTNFVGEFRLSALAEADIGYINLLRK